LRRELLAIFPEVQVYAVAVTENSVFYFYRTVNVAGTVNVILNGISDKIVPGIVIALLVDQHRVVVELAMALHFGFSFAIIICDLILENVNAISIAMSLICSKSNLNFCGLHVHLFASFYGDQHFFRLEVMDYVSLSFSTWLAT
jgi:hypothetical protein